MDIRTIFLAQTCAQVATAAMLWVARSEADRRNGLRSWTLAILAQGLAYLLLSQAGRLPVLLSATLGNALGALSVALYFAALRQFLGQGIPRGRLLAMGLAVSLMATLAGADYAWATIFNGFVYGLMELLNARVLWRHADPQLARVQRVVALFYLLMGLILPLRALGLLLHSASLNYLDLPIAWQQPIYVFGFVYIIATNLGFVQMCKMRAEAEVRELALTDGLTGLPNRRALDLAMDTALRSAARSGQPFAVLMVDIDHFKAINDRHGHHAGDLALAGFARRLCDGMRASDHCFRYGGEEFCALLPDSDAAQARVLAERMRAQAEQAVPDGSAAASASFGIAIWQPGDDARSLFGRADRALYRAKQGGRNRVELGA